MIKNILNYTKILICFAVSSLLLLSFSYSSITANTSYSYLSGTTNSSVTSYGGYSYSSIRSALSNYHNDSTSLDNIMQDMINNNYVSQYLVYRMNNYNYLSFVNSNIDFASVFVTSNYYRLYYVKTAQTVGNGYFISTENNNYLIQTNIPSSIGFSGGNGFGGTLLYSTSNVYSVTQSGGNYGDMTWDGTSYYYQATPPEPSYVPTNAEIADKVQEFYNSDLFQNQNDFKDYFVLYNYNNETFSFIGHNLGDNIGQIIYRADFPQNTTGVDYWSFYLVDLATHIWNWFNNYYWLYTTTLDFNTITYTGKGAVTDLLDLKFNPTYSTIVYSTTNYPCQIYGWDDTNHEITIESETISGDSYTYDENINPTTSEYNPITNYVLPNSIDTLISNADIPGLLQIWVTPDFSNMDWIFLSISAFWGYFGGFVLLTAIMFFIMWLLRGD